MSRRYPEPRRMISADEARARGVNAIRGLVIGLAISCAFWAVIIGAYVVGQSR